MFIKKNTPFLVRVGFIFLMSIGYIGLSTIVVLVLNDFEQLTAKDFWDNVIIGVIVGFLSQFPVPFIEKKIFGKKEIENNNIENS